MPKIHFRSYIHNQMQRIDKDIVKCPQIVSADNLSNTKKEERITLHLLMEFAREELSLIKYKTKRRKIIKVHLSLCFVIKYTFSTPWKRKTPCKSRIYKGFVVPRPAFEILNMGTFELILLNLTIKYKSLVINEIKKSYIYSDWK